MPIFRKLETASSLPYPYLLPDNALNANPNAGPGIPEHQRVRKPLVARPTLKQLLDILVFYCAEIRPTPGDIWIAGPLPKVPF